ncbi:MAG: hypothetical protein IJL60_04450 [Clostridiales bacterium]|nr:hypothetical protein [Clostridiales bacterium]
MRKSKRMANVAALLMALVILFIPFGSISAAPWAAVKFNNVSLYNDRSDMVHYDGCEYYIVEGSNTFLTGTIEGINPACEMTVTVRNRETDTDIRKATTMIKPINGIDYYDLRLLTYTTTCQNGYLSPAAVQTCSNRDFYKALMLKDLPAGFYSFTFNFNGWGANGRIIYVRILPREIHDFVKSTYYNLGLSLPTGSKNHYMKTVFQLYKKKISARTFIWNTYYDNYLHLASLNRNSAVRRLGSVIYVGSMTTGELEFYNYYARVFGLPYTVDLMMYKSAALRKQCQMIGINY